MPIEVCAVLLAAGEGTRLRPLTGLRPKALCPVGNLPLLDHALARVAALGLVGPAAVAVNACWLGEQVAAHVTGRAHLSYEPAPLGTAGGVARLRDWIDGRGVLVGNADAYLAGGRIDGLLAGWDGETVRLLGVPGSPGDFSGYDFAGFSLLPWRLVRDLPESLGRGAGHPDSGQPGTGELVRAVWRPAEAAGALAVVEFTGHFRDTGTPADYLAANLHAAAAGSEPSGNEPGGGGPGGSGAGGNLIAPDATVTGRCEQAVVGAGATVHGTLRRAVVWPGSHVAASEQLTDAIRAAELTVTPTGVATTIR